MKPIIHVLSKWEPCSGGSVLGVTAVWGDETQGPEIYGEFFYAPEFFQDQFRRESFVANRNQNGAIYLFTPEQLDNFVVQRLKNYHTQKKVMSHLHCMRCCGAFSPCNGNQTAWEELDGVKGMAGIGGYFEPQIKHIANWSRCLELRQIADTVIKYRPEVIVEGMPTEFPQDATP